MSDVACYSALGRRSNQEDAAAAFVTTTTAPVLHDTLLLLVCDGAGGMAGGEVASHIALTVTARQVETAMAAATLPSLTGSKLERKWAEVLDEALRAANEAILREAARRPGLHGMASTAVCALVIDGALTLAWAGDSRAYRFAAGRLLPLTSDHTTGEECVRAGLLDREDIEYEALASRLTRYLGQPTGFEPAIRESALDADDVLLLCSDGVSGVLGEEDLAALLAPFALHDQDARTTARNVVQAAFQAGGSDNATAVVARCAVPDRRATELTRTDGYARRLIHATTIHAGDDDAP